MNASFDLSFFNFCPLAESVIAETAQSDVHALAALLQAFAGCRQPSSLRFFANALPRLRPLLCHPNPEYEKCALDLIHQALNELGDDLKDTTTANNLNGHANGANGANNSVMDERQRLRLTCRKALTEIYVNAPLISPRIHDLQRETFESVMPLLRALVE